MSFDHCLISLDLSNKLPVSKLRELSQKYTRAGIGIDAAMRIVLHDQLEQHRTQERAIVAAVRSAWEEQGRPGATEAPRDKNQAPDLNEMFTQLLAEEAAAKPKSDDLNSMFDELLAEVSGVDPRPTVDEVVKAADKPKKTRAKKAEKTAPVAEKAADLPAPPKRTGPTPESLIRKFAKTPGEVQNGQVRKILLDAGPMAGEVAKILGEHGHLVTAVGDAMEGMGWKYTGMDGLKPIFEQQTRAPINRNSYINDGTTVYDKQGNPFRVHYQRNALVIAHPIVDGKPQVSADTTVRFWTDPNQPPAGENDRLDPIYTSPPAGAQGASERGAGAAAKSAAVNSAKGFSDAIKGLGALFDPNAAGSGPVISEESYARAVPLFKQAIQHFSDAAADVRDVMKAIIKAVYEQFGHATTAKMQPYVVRFVEEYRNGKHQGENNAAESAAGSAARDQEHRADEKPAAEQDLFDVGGRDHAPAPGAAGQLDRAGAEQVDRAGVSGHDAATGREEGDQHVHGQEPGSDGRTAERGDAAGSGRDGREGARPERGPAGDAGNAADARDDAGGKLEQQRRAAAVPVKLGDRNNIDATLPYLLEPQRGDVHFAETRFAAAGDGKMPGVLFTNGTGTGKTASGAGIIARQIRSGKTEGIIVVPNTGIAHDWIEFGKRLGIDINLLESTSEHGGSGATITTYANFGANKTLADREYHWVMADESHYLMAAKDGKMTDALATFRALTGHPDGFAQYHRMRNRDLFDKLATIDNKESPEAKEIFRQLLDRKGPDLANYPTEPKDRPKAIFLSATPFAYVKSVDYAEGYLFNYPEDGKIGNSNQDGRAKFFVEHFGYRIRYHKLTTPDGNVDVGLMARQFNSWLKREGALSGRMLEVDHDYGRRFIKVESALGEKIDEGMEYMRNHPEYKHLYQPFMRQFNYLSRRYLLEAIKAKESLPIIQAHLDLGRKVIVIHDYKKGGGRNPFTMDGINGTTTAYDSSMSPKTIDLAALADKFKAERPDLVQLQFPSASALGTLRSAFPNALVHNGDIPEKQLEQNKVLFNDDNSGRNVIILQSDKGREGISLHDTTGVHPRVEVVVGMAAKPTALIQLEGRAYRTGQKSNVAFDYTTTGTNWEQWTFAQTIAERTDIAEALAMGDDARALKDSIVEAYENAGPHEITENDGTGGKARDRQAARLLTDWDRAKSFYYAQLKRNSGNKSTEGKDYYATPEPVGLKMVEWADIRPGEDVLEPSAGHGAIARWFPTLSNKTINERESGLIGKARLAVDGKARFIQGDFEDLDLVNKFDTIVMNPPFGVGGSKAIPHLAKAYQHLRDGGRIVALLPRGPAADGKLEAFLHGDKAPKDLYMVADIEMPGSTFERAGTGVMTHIVVLDKISDESKAPQQISRSYVGADDVNDLFDHLQHSTVPGRVKNDLPIELAIEQGKPAPKKQPREAAPDATGAERYYAQFEFNHTKTGEKMYGTAMLNRTSMDTYKEAAAIAKQYGGWYNKFVGGGALRGFLFKSDSDRAAFMAEAGQLAEVSAGHDAQNSMTGDLGIDSALIDHMESIADSRGMVKADQLADWVRQQGAPGAAPLADWLGHMGNADVAQSSVVKFMEHSGNAMFSKMPGFYSALARTVPDMAKIAGKDGTVKAEQARLWLQSRQKEGKFKAEELQWSGVDDWLKAQGGRVAVADIANFLEHNGVQVDEVQKVQDLNQAAPTVEQLAEASPEDVAQLRAHGFEPEANPDMPGELWFRHPDGDDPVEARHIRTDYGVDRETEAAAKRLTQVFREMEPVYDNTKYGQYTLRGGKNYRELLLTLPQNNREFILPEMLTELPDGYEVNFDRTQPEGRQYSVIPPGQMHAAPYGAVRAATAEDARREALAVLNSERDNAARDQHRATTSGDGYRSSHWDERNIIAHIRFNDRVDADGKRVLFIEELQSDWGQEGLKRGFAGAHDLTQASIDEATAAARQAVEDNDMLGFDSMGQAMSAIRNHADWADRWDVDTPAQRQAIDRYRDMLDAQRQMSGKPPVAPGPFVTDTKAWLGLGIKRMIRYAAENGYDRVAFVNGEQSADRYDLSKQVDSINYEPTTKGYSIDIIANGRSIRKGDFTRAELADIVGKEIVDKMDAREGKRAGDDDPVLDQLGVGEMRTLAGDGLKVGGEGMKSFYDKIVPQTLNDVLKKVGGGKAVKIKMGARDELLTQAAQARADGMADGAAEIEGEANDALGHQIGFDMTPELREKAMAGMPLFSRAVDQGRRRVLALAAAAAMHDASGKATTLGQARPMNQALLDERVPASVEKILRRDGITGRQLESGTTNMKGADTLREAMRAIALTGPKELRALAAQVAKLLPTSGVMLTVDDTRRMNVHGVVELSPLVHMQLFTAEGRTGLTYGTIIHEALHVAVAARYRSLSVGMARENDKLLGLSKPKAAEAMKQFEGVWNEFRQLTAGEKFANRDLELAISEARGNPDEFFVRALTDPLLQNYLAGKRYEGKTMWERFKDWVKTSLFGFGPESGTAPSWLDAALTASHDVVEAMGGDTGDFSRMKAINRYQASRATENSRASMDDNPDAMNSRRQLPPATWSMPADDRLDKVLNTLQDKHIDMKRAVKSITDAIGDLGDKWDPYLQEELYHGRSATGFKDFLEGELRPLLVDMQARGVSMEQLEEYLHMRHAGEANARLASINDGNPDGLAGVSTQDASDYLANLAPAKERALAALAARVDNIIKGTQQTLLDYGLEKQSTIDAWNATYQHYVPLHRADMDKNQLGNGTGSGFSVRGAASKQRTGSKRQVVDILANVAMARERAIVRGEKNRISMALYGLALQAPNPTFWKPINPQKNPAALEHELLSMGLSPAEASAIIDAPRKRRINPNTGMVESYVSLADRNLPNVVSTRINGEDRFLFFNDKDDRAMRMAQAVKNVGEDVLGWTMNKVAWATRQIAAFNTQFNPIFGIVNLMRDTSEGAVNLSSTPLAGKQLAVLGEAGRLLGKVILARGRLGNLTGADQALWHEFEQEGGITGFRAMFSRSEDRTAELARELRQLSHNPVAKAGGAIMAWLSDYNEALENITRMAAYKVAKDNGLTNQRAASLAKNLTVNFNRKGSKTRILGALFAFFNAAVQGMARSAQTLAGPAGKRIVAGGLFLGMIQATMLHAWGFDDADIPQFVRAKNLIIPASRPGHGKNYLTIPLPQGFAFLPTLGRLGTEFALGGAKKPGKFAANMAESLVDTFNPLGSSTLLQTITPTVADPVAALAENKDWTGKPIARQDYSPLHPTPGFTRAKETASVVGKWIAHGINTMTGGTDYAPGGFSPTPDQIDYFIGQFTGGVGREAMKAQQTISAQFTGEDVPWNRVPLVGRFYGDVNDKSAISTRFYDNVKDLADTAAEVDGRQKAHVSSKEFRASHPDWKLAEKSEVVLRELADLGQRRRHYLALGDKARVKEFELRIRTRMQKFNDEVAAAQKAAQ